VVVTIVVTAHLAMKAVATSAIVAAVVLAVVAVATAAKNECRLI
jgi:hypothetical protein